MRNSVAVGRHQARKALIVQCLAVVVVALAMLAAGPAQALATALGGAGLALGSGLAAWIAFGGQAPAAAGLAMGRVLAGMALKWLMLLGVLGLGVAVWHLPPAGLVVGVLVALVAQTLAMLMR